MKRVIKYAALLFALVLAATIIGSCLTAGVAVVQMIADKSADGVENNRNSGNDIWYRDEEGDVVFLGIHFGNSGDVKSGSETYKGSEIDSLYLEGASGEVIVEAWENDYISVVYENIPEDYEIYNDNGTLIIELDGNFFSWGIAFTETPKIHVSVPAAKTLEQVEIDKGSGSAKISGLLADTLEVENGSGGLGISKVTVRELRVESGSGGVTISDATAQKSVFDSGSGSFIVKNSQTGETSMDTGSGFVNFENIVADNLVVDSGSGRVDVSGQLTGNCVFESGSGSLNVVVYGNMEDYNFRTDMGSGSFYLNGRKEDDTELNVKHAGADNLLVFDAGSGRVSLEFTEVQSSLEEVSEDAGNTSGENYDR